MYDNLPVSTKEKFVSRESLSKKKLKQLKHEISKLPSANDFDGLSIVVAGSFARLDGSFHSDVDLFFFCNKKKSEVQNSKSMELKLFGDLITLIKNLGYPDFSNDCEFLEIMYVQDKLEQLGSPEDDHANFFTARMLLLLESHCVFGDEAYTNSVTAILERYFADYPKHQNDFTPTFLINDISRYWKTLLLNYESKRGLPNAASFDYESKKNKHSIRNFKLKFSRLTTCFATICAISASKNDCDINLILKLVSETPRSRLSMVKKRVENTSELIDEIFEDYAWFLGLTELSISDLESEFSTKESKIEHFDKANKYRKKMFELVKLVSKETENDELISLLVM